MGIGDQLETWDGWQAAVAALAWQVDLGASDPVTDTPLNRYDIPAEQPRMAAVAPPAVQAAPILAATDPTAIAQSLADAAQNLDALRDAIAS
ncbi:MAG: uracil-DNA glycosylase, partial [Paracoccaceae bacterium]